MADEKVAPLPLPAVPVQEEKEQAPAADPPFPGVRHVLIWALLNAGIVAFSIAYALIMPPLLPPPRPTGREEDVHVPVAEVVVAVALAAGILLCAVSQAAAGALGLMLRRHRLILDYAALVATAAGQCMWAGLHIMFVAADGGLSFSSGVTTAALLISGIVDIVGFQSLLSIGEGEQ